MEKRDLYDENKQKTGEIIEKGQPVPTGKYYITVVVWMQNFKGEFLIQRTVPEKHHMWATTGGHPKSGESSLEGIVSEIKEELNLDVNPNELKLFKTIKTEDDFVDLYYLKHDFNIEEITPELVRDCLTPIWQKFPATAKKVKTVIHKVLQWAIAMHKRENRENPAALDGALGVLIEPLQNNIKPAENHAACAIDEIPRLFVEMNDFDSMSAYACMFAILTAARSKAVRFAEWDEIDFEKKIWIIPVEHDKVKTPKRDRTIFLSDEAIALLKRVPKISGVPYIFPSRQGGHLSDVTITMFLRRLHKKRLVSDGIGWVDPDKSAMLKKPCIITFHGTARASFRTWAKNDDLGNNRKFDQEAVEYCLLHQKDDGYNKAYDRAQLAKERIKIMHAWGKYCFSCLRK